MSKEDLQNLYDEYQEKIDSIIQQYGDSDGFVIKGELWWNYYRTKINELLKKINNNSFTIEDAEVFYKKFGFGPKLYMKSFVENGIEPIIKLFKFLQDETISAEEKIFEITENSDSEINIRGIGINFITLFLTSLYPQKYVQWNKQINEALKILDMYPRLIRGEKRSKLYTRINEKCKQIMEFLELENLARADNFLYCISKGYIGNPEEIIKKETEVMEEIEFDFHDDKIDNKHLEMTYYLAKIGFIKGYDVWVATNDKNKEYNDEKINSFCIDDMPKFTEPGTLAQAQFIDVIWFRKKTTNPIRFFEIEHTTSIYSGLLRLNDVKINFPISKATIVIPVERQNLFEKQLTRTTFTHSELSDVVDSLNYKQLREWHDAVVTEAKYN
jgi:hypothetical protein